MEDDERPTERHDLDPAADTGKFQAFVGDAEPYRVGARPQVFRIVTLLVGLAAFAAIVFLLLR